MTPTSTPESLGFSAERLKRIDAHLQLCIDKKYLKGINALISRNNEIVYSASVGRQGEADTALNMDSLFRIYSMTKPITTVAALLLYEQGKFLLDDPVAKFLPYFAETKVHAGQEHLGMKLVPQKTPMTIRHLMTHTAGLSYGWFQDTPVDGLYRATGVDPSTLRLGDFVKQLASLPLVYQPGTNWRYSAATDVLGHLVEVVADEPLEAFMERNIFEPLGMTDTSFSVPTDKLDRLTTVYAPNSEIHFGVDYSALPKGELHAIDKAEKSRFVNPQHAVSGFSGGGGLVSTMTDYLQFASMLLNNGKHNGVQLLGRKTIELMSKNHVPTDIRPLEIGGNPMHGNGFGLGVAVIEDIGQFGNLASDGNYGWSGAAMTNFWIDPKENIIGLMMTQFMPSDFHRLQDEFRTLTYQALVD